MRPLLVRSLAHVVLLTDQASTRALLAHVCRKRTLPHTIRNHYPIMIYINVVCNEQVRLRVPGRVRRYILANKLADSACRGRESVRSLGAGRHVDARVEPLWDSGCLSRWHNDPTEAVVLPPKILRRKGEVSAKMHAAPPTRMRARER